MIASPHGLILVGSVIIDHFGSHVYTDTHIYFRIIWRHLFYRCWVFTFLPKDSDVGQWYMIMFIISKNSNLFMVPQLKYLQLNLSLFRNASSDLIYNSF